MHIHVYNQNLSNDNNYKTMCYIKTMGAKSYKTLWNTILSLSS